MKKPSSNKSRLAGLIGTVIFHVVVLIVLLTIFVRYNPAEEATREWPPADSSQILFGGEYVMVGDIPDPSASVAEPAPEATPEPAPEPPVPAEPTTPAISTTRPSPSKVVKNDQAAERARAADRAREQKEIDEKNRRQQQQQQQRQAATNRVSGAFAGKGSQGSPNGNSTRGVTAGQPGTDLKGRTLAHWTRPSSTEAGTITVNVVVNASGAVTSATYNPGRSKGGAAASASARASCIAAARQCRFSVATDGTTTQRGTISFHFK